MDAMKQAGLLSAVRRPGWLLLAALWAGPAMAQPATKAPPVPAAQPKIVVQAISEFGIDVAAWSPDGQYIWTASGMARELLLWDAGQGIIIDRLRLPAPAKVTIDFMRLTGMTMAADGRSLTITGEAYDRNTEIGVRGRRYQIDVRSRRISIDEHPPEPEVPPGATWDSLNMAWIDALQVAYSDITGQARDAALRLLPALPRSPDGRTAMLRAGTGFTLKPANGAERAPRVTGHLGSIADAELSPDERHLAVLSLNDEVSPETGEILQSVQLLDLVNGRMLPPVALAGKFDRVAWLDRERLALLSQSDMDDPLKKDNPSDLPSAIAIIKAATGEVLAQPSARCFMAALPDGRIVGAGLANCRSKLGNDKALQILADGKWSPYRSQAIPRDAHVRLLAVSPAGDRFAYAVRLGNGEFRIQTVDIASGESGPFIQFEEAFLSLIRFSPDGRRLWVAGDGTLMEWTIDAPYTADGKPVIRELPGAVELPQRMASNGRRLMVGGAFEERIQMIALPKPELLREVDFPGAAAVGFMRTRPALWAASITEGVRVWDQRSGAVLLTIRLLPGGRFVAVAPDGRYDTNMGPDSENFRWMISDQPWRSLAPQTLMRDYYEPRLIAKLMDCTAAGNCATALHRVPPVAGLNRQLPVVEVVAVRPAEPGRVDVDVRARETRDRQTGLASGVYGLKLLMNNREIVKTPDDPLSAAPADLAGWRDANLSPPDDASGRRSFTFNVPIPTDGKPIRFSAYSFNADRVKSDTAHLDWQPPPQARRPRRAYVLTIGVNDYVERRLNLNFAVPDAELIGQRLAAIRGFEVRRISLTSTPTRPVTAGHIASALLILGGIDPEEDRGILRAGGHDGSLLAEATPDDIVIISFSGHGHAAPNGTFSLLASNARWGALDAAPDPGTVLPADVLTLLLGRIQAGEIAFIIDACHSGAAVNTPDFKPGPMGDPGLGQLAFDKGMRILAATQGDDVALENPNLAHGLLSAALGEGLTPTGGLADMDGDGKIPLDEWLRYAVARLPSLHEEVRRGGGPVIARGVRLVLRSSNEPPPVQEPSLFDFTNTISPVLLRGQP